MKASLTLLLALVTLSSVVLAQAPSPAGSDRLATDSVRLSGRVLDAHSGQPIKGALVRATSAETAPGGRAAHTDASGRWMLADLPPGRYQVVITRDWYGRAPYRPRNATGDAFSVHFPAGSAFDHDVRLLPAGAISGQIRDDHGRGVPGVRVAAVKARYVASRRRLFPVGDHDVTDEAGRYRLVGVPAGDYLISASVETVTPGKAVARGDTMPTFFPGTYSPDAGSKVTVVAGEELWHINFPLAPGRLATVSGTVLTASGKPLTAGLALMQGVSPSAILVGSTANVRDDGRFSFSNVPPGDYTISTRYMPKINQRVPPGESRYSEVLESAFVRLTVTDEDMTDLTIRMAPTAEVHGRVIFEKGVPPEAGPAGMAVRGAVTSADREQPGGVGSVRDDWTFRITGLSGARRFQLSGVPAGWFLKRIRYQGTDITDTGLEMTPRGVVNGVEVVLTQHPTELHGIVVDSERRPVAGANVVLFARDKEKWTYLTRSIQFAKADAQGRFVMRSLPEDEYVIIALEHVEPGDENDPELLENWLDLATAARVPARHDPVVVPLQAAIGK